MGIEEIRELAEGPIAVELENRTVVRIVGEEPLRFLDATTTQDLAPAAVGRGALSCLLDDKGRILSEFRVLPLSDGTVLLDGEPAARDALTGWLARIAPLSACEVIDESGSWTFTSIRDGGDDPLGEHTFAERDDEIAIRVRWGGQGTDVLSRRRAARAPSEDPALLEAIRIAGGRPRFGVDIEPGVTLINETPLIERAVSHSKGCYPGQESVARVRNLGRIRRKLVRLRAADPIPAGASLALGGAAVGVVTSAAGGFAIARISAEVADGTTIDAGGNEATVEDLW